MQLIKRILLSDYFSACLFLFCLSLFSAPIFAQEDSALELKDYADVIETEIDYDQIKLQGQEEVRPKSRMSRAARKLTKDPAYKKEKSDTSPSVAGDEVILLNQTLKKMIEENENLAGEKEDLEEQLRFLRGQRALESNRMNTITKDMKNLVDRTESVVDLNKSYAKQILQLKNEIAAKEKEYQDKMQQMVEKPTEEEAPGLMKLSGRASKAKKDYERIISMLENYGHETRQLTIQTAQLHYNLGNTHFHRGEYESAVLEYRKALLLDPQDPAAHFNLAFVSGEYLQDFETALKHYREYLLLRPNAEDLRLVQEKILSAEMEIKTQINSPVDKRYNFVNF